jgi:hypothetical protein
MRFPSSGLKTRVLLMQKHTRKRTMIAEVHTSMMTNRMIITSMIIRIHTTTATLTRIVTLTITDMRIHTRMTITTMTTTTTTITAMHPSNAAFSV